MIYTIGVTATRAGLVEKQRDNLWRVLRRIEPRAVRIGDCVGGDADVHALILRMHWTYRDGFRRPRLIAHLPDDDRQRAFLAYDEQVAPKPFRERNKDIAEQSDLTIALPRTNDEELRSGTWATARDAYRADKSVLILWPDGLISDIWSPTECQCGETAGDWPHGVDCWRYDSWLYRTFPARPFSFRYAQQTGE